MTLQPIRVPQLMALTKNILKTSVVEFEKLYLFVSWTNTISYMLHVEKFVTRYSPIHFTMGTYFEVIFDTLGLYKQGLMSLPKLQSMRSTTTKPNGSTYHELSLKFYWVFSLGQRVRARPCLIGKMSLLFFELSRETR